MGLSALPEFTYWLPRLKIYSHMGILRHNHSVHSIDCNNKLAPFRDCTFYYQQNKTRKEILPEFGNIHHPWVLCVVLSSRDGDQVVIWLFSQKAWWVLLCCQLSLSGLWQITLHEHHGVGWKRWFLDGGCETDAWSASPRGKQCKCPGFVLVPVRAGMRWEQLNVILQKSTVISLNQWLTNLVTE